MSNASKSIIDAKTANLRAIKRVRHWVLGVVDIFIAFNAGLIKRKYLLTPTNT